MPLCPHCQTAAALTIRDSWEFLFSLHESEGGLKTCCWELFEDRELKIKSF